MINLRFYVSLKVHVLLSTHVFVPLFCEQARFLVYWGYINQSWAFSAQQWEPAGGRWSLLWAGILPSLHPIILVCWSAYCTVMLGCLVGAYYTQKIELFSRKISRLLLAVLSLNMCDALIAYIVKTSSTHPPWCGNSIDGYLYLGNTCRASCSDTRWQRRRSKRVMLNSRRR